MPEQNPKTKFPASYGKLKMQIQTALEQGKARAEKAVEQEKIRTYWEIGRLIESHIKKEKPEAGRAEYGKRVVLRLAVELSLNQTFLYNAVNFARTYPIFAPARKLGWSHYRELLEVEDRIQRQRLEKLAVSEQWSRRELDEQIKEIKNPQSHSKTSPSQKRSRPPRFIPKRGKLNTYRMHVRDYVDLGFSTFIRPDLRDLIGFKEGDILQFQDGKFSKLKEGTRTDIYTYRAGVERVVDGDTLWLWVELGFKVCLRQKVRLRAVNAPELNTPEGQRVKRFVESEVKKVPLITITTTKPDKYDRYLCDVYLGVDESAPSLNKLLLDRGLARYFDASAEKVWDFSNSGRF